MRRSSLRGSRSRDRKRTGPNQAPPATAAALMMPKAASAIAGQLVEAARASREPLTGTVRLGTIPNSVGSNIQRSHEPRVRVQSCSDRDVGRADSGQNWDGLNPNLRETEYVIRFGLRSSLRSWPVLTDLDRWRVDVVSL